MVTSPGQKMRSHFMFTLIELLIVVGIIAILLSILLPSLTIAREKSKRAVCLSNLKQIYTATSIYTKNNNYYYPKRPVNFSHQPSALEDGLRPGSGFRHLWEDYLPEVIEESKEGPAIFSCPSLPIKEIMEWGDPHYIISYNYWPWYDQNLRTASYWLKPGGLQPATNSILAETNSPIFGDYSNNMTLHTGKWHRAAHTRTGGLLWSTSPPDGINQIHNNGSAKFFYNTTPYIQAMPWWNPGIIGGVLE